MVEVMLRLFPGLGFMRLAASISFENNRLGRHQLPCLITLRLPCCEEAQLSHMEALQGETE